MSESALIVAAIGSTPGLLWEIDRLVARCPSRSSRARGPTRHERADQGPLGSRRRGDHRRRRPVAPRARRPGVCARCPAAAGRTWQVAIADRRDEAAYRAAVDVQLRATLGSGVTDRRSLATRTVAMGRRIAGTIADPKTAIAALRAQLTEDLAALRADIRRVLTDAAAHANDPGMVVPARPPGTTADPVNSISPVRRGSRTDPRPSPCRAPVVLLRVLSGFVHRRRRVLALCADSCTGVGVLVRVLSGFVHGRRRVLAFCPDSCTRRPRRSRGRRSDRLVQTLGRTWNRDRRSGRRDCGSIRSRPTTPTG